MANDPTFRDFAGAIMAGNLDEATRVLGILLALDPATAATATAHFQQRMKDGDPAFMDQAMGLRQAVASTGDGADAALGALLTACFGLEAGARDAAIGALRGRYVSDP
jgi:hypothetical protein